MNTDRPKIEVPLEPFDLIIDLLNITILLLACGYVMVNYFDLPETIPMHFDAQGNPDSYGHKASIWILPAISVFTFALMFILNKYPHTHNYMFTITKDNALANYRLSTRALRLVNLYCMLLFAAIVYDIINMAKGMKATFIGFEFIMFSMLIPIIIVVYLLVKQKQINT